MGIKIGAEFNLDLTEFVLFDAFIANLSHDFFESGDGLFGGIFRLVINRRYHQRGAVVIEKIARGIIDCTRGLNGDLAFEHQTAVDAASASAMQRAIENSGSVPIRSAATWRAMSDGHRR